MLDGTIAAGSALHTEAPCLAGSLQHISARSVQLTEIQSDATLKGSPSCELCFAKVANLSGYMLQMLLQKFIIRLCLLLQKLCDIYVLQENLREYNKTS